MKHIYVQLLLLTFGITLLTSCEHHENDPRLLAAERLMDSNPDSAKEFLLHDSARIKSEKLSSRMYYALLLTLSEDKCYIPHTSDSTMLTVVDYYENHGTPHQKLESYYLLGRVYTDLNMTADAIKYYQKALSVEGTDSSDIYLARTNNQIGHLYMFQNMYEKARPYFYSSYKYASAAKDSTVMVFALRDIGRCYNVLGDKRKCMSFYDQTVNLLKRTDKSELAQHIYPEIIIAYDDAKEYVKARQCLASILHHQPSEDDATIFYVGGEVYLSTNKLDSAIFFYKKCLESVGQNLYSKKNAAYRLHDIYQKKKLYNKASAYADSCIIYVDSISQMTLSENENLIQSLNNKLVVEKKISELRRNIIVIILASIFIIFIIIVAIRLKLKRIKEKEALYESVKKTLELRSKEYKEKAEKKLADLNLRIETADRENDNLKMRILQLEVKKEEENIGKMVWEEEQQKLIQEAFRETDLYRYFMNKTKTGINNFIPNEKWDELEEYLNENFDQFCKQLSRKYKVEKRNLRMCCLIKLCFTNKEIGELFCISRSAVSNIRSRLYCKLFGKNGSATDLDDFIRSFPDCVNKM